MDQPITGGISGSVDVEVSMEGRVSTWRTASSAQERVERLHRMHLRLVKQVDDNRRQARAKIEEAVTDEAKERRTADQQLTRRIADVEEALKVAAEEQVEVNTAGLPVVFAGIVLTALPDIFAIFSWWSAIPVVAGVVAWLLVLARSIVGSLEEQEA